MQVLIIWFLSWYLPTLKVTSVSEQITQLIFVDKIFLAFISKKVAWDMYSKFSVL